MGPESPAVENRWFGAPGSSFQQGETRQSPAEPVGTRAERTAKHSERNRSHTWQEADMTRWDGTGVCGGWGGTADTRLAHRGVNVTGTFPSSPPESFRCCKSEQKFAAAETIKRQQQQNKSFSFGQTFFFSSSIASARTPTARWDGERDPTGLNVCKVPDRLRSSRAKSSADCHNTDLPLTRRK